MADSKNKGSLADQLAGLDISVQKESERDLGAERAPEPEDPPEPEPPPEPPSDEALFVKAMEGISDDELARQMERKEPDLEARGAMADALADVKPVSSRRRRPAEPEVPESPKPSAPRAEQPKRDRPLTDDELFAAAVDGLDPTDIYRGKYLGEADVPEAEEGPSTEDFDDVSPEERASEEASAREELRDRQNKRTLERALGGVDKRMNNSKYRTREPAPPPAYSSEDNEEMITEPLPKSGEGLNDVELTGAQRELLKRHEMRRRDRQIPELNVRGDTLDDALRRLELFAHQSWKDGVGFMRVIHGKGNQSEGDPVLKPAVLRWLEGPGFRYVRGYAPEIKRAGNYGSLIVELEAND